MHQLLIYAPASKLSQLQVPLATLNPYFKVQQLAILLVRQLGVTVHLL